ARILGAPTRTRPGLDHLTHARIGADDAAAGASRAAGAGAAPSTVANNLPAYAAGEAVVPVEHRTQLLALLIGTNVGPFVTSWASLATLLCLEFCRAHGVRIALSRFVRTGLVVAVLATTASVAALLLVA